MSILFGILNILLGGFLLLGIQQKWRWLVVASFWSLFSLIAGVVAIYRLPGQPGEIFAFTGIVASVLLAAVVYILARSDK